VGHDWGMTVSTRGSILPPVKKYCLLWGMIGIVLPLI
jgi:hypothetical protein